MAVMVVLHALSRAVADLIALSAGAVRHASGFSWDATGDGLLATYRGALAGRSPLPLRAAQ